MKLAYNNWHKEVVHDDAIQSELNSITDGQLEFTNTPYVKAYSMKQDLSLSKITTLENAISSSNSVTITTIIITATVVTVTVIITATLRRSGFRIENVFIINEPAV
ncbi:hypothetical protein LWM68_46040 [Niabella sp. W65]|nr:hypothetical protein [Niabella sp. W65]MCH7369450.1 hypothetical protein [Niabella sp. W65]ULT44981.1 hypothetical protein KRR40_17750 [Niabella sp. I65]